MEGSERLGTRVRTAPVSCINEVHWSNEGFKKGAGEPNCRNGVTSYDNGCGTEQANGEDPKRPDHPGGPGKR